MKDVSRESSPQRFSPSQDRQHVFEKQAAPQMQSVFVDGDWIDLYRLLNVPPDTSSSDLDEAIIARGADAVYFTLSRASQTPQSRLLEKYLHDMRPILLDPAVRRRYDDQLRRHRNHDPGAMRYEDFKSTLDIREESGSCMTSLIFLILMPWALWSLEKIISTKFL